MPHPAVRLVEISEERLSVESVLASLDDPAAGGLVLFVGRIRDHDNGSGVTDLAYSAHPTALDRMRTVCDAIAEEYDVTALAAVHRVGDLAIGDLAVVVATTAAHRGDSFQASKALIDSIKEQVPIWKHQRFTDGTEEWVGAP